MKKQCLIYVAVLSLLCVLGCKEGKKNILEYSKYISGFTQGMIRSTDPIYIRLESAALKFNDSLPVPVESLFKIAPDVSGTLTFRGGVVEFHPSERLKNDHTYQVSLRLDPICDVPDNLKTFQFQIKTIPQTFAFQEGGLDIEEGEEKLFRYRGTIVNADLLENQEEVEKLVKASFDKASPDVEWEHLTPYAHLFTVHRLKRGTETKILTLTFNQKVKNGNDLLVEIPGENTFSVLEIRPGDSESRSIQIVMSDNLDASQNLQGLIGVEEVKNMKYDIEGNIVRVYTDEQEKLQGVVQVTVHQGIRSKIGDKLPADITLPLSFPSVNPRVDLFMNAPITPSEGDAIIPFTAVGLKAVQLRVVKLFAQNMNFYLQMSDYDKENTGSRHEFSRVARLVLNKKINLVKEGELFDPDVWQDYTINLADHLTLEKGVIYRLELRFQRSYTGMPCARNQEDKLLTEDNWDNPQRDDYEYYDDDDGDYYYSYPSDFVWEERNDPCSNSYYYMRDRFPHRNIIVTSLGLLAKAGIDGKYAVAVTDLLTAAPVENCTLYFYNYQNQKIDSARTNAAGIATARPPGKPFVIVAQKGNDKVHLKVSDNTALSFSNFDVSGAVIQQGLKGFIYGERDVWRPGNDIYLSFMLEDKENLIPAGHPIIAELYDPSGNIVQVKRETRNEHGLYCFPLKTDADAVTGYWRAVVKVGGAHFTKTVRVETIKPNRLTINVQLPAPVLGEGVAATRVPVQTRWMHGAKTSNLETNTVLRLSHARTTFPNFGDYTFDLARYFEATETTIFDGKTDADGNFTIPLADIDASSPPGMLNALLTTQVFENGGDFSIVTTAFKYSPYKEYVGIKLPEAGENGYTPGSSIAVQGVTVQPDGKQAGNSEIELEVYSVNWRWWWDSDNDELGSYIARSYNKPVYTTTVRAANGKFSASVSCAKFGRYYILAHDKASGHSTGATFHVYNRGAADLPGAATLLGLSSNKKAYTVGDKIEITFPSSAGSTAIVSIENGKTVKEITRVVATAGTTTFTTTATEEMCPNAYINITLVQPHLNRTNDKTIRLYGVLNIPVEAPALRLQPRVDMPDELRPSSDFTLAVTETDGKPMTYTIAIVDEGLLALTSFRTPDPFPAFYAREALGVKTWDFYDQVAGAHGARVAKAFAIGGDEAIVDDGKRKSDRFTPVVIFRGPFTLRPGGRDTHNFTMPEYIGETRVMIIAEDNGRYGSVAKSVKVNNPLMLNVTMPRLFTPGDIIDIPVTVFAMKENVKDVEVTLKTDPLVEIIGTASQSARFTEIGEQIIFFKIKTRENTGRSTLSFNAGSGQETAHFSTDVDIRVPNPRVTRVDAREIKPGETVTFDNAIDGLDPLSILEITTIPPLNLEQRLDELIRYPHGCGEQITSAVYPQLMLDALTDLSDAQRVTTELHVKEVINRLRNYQVSDGGFAYWTNASHASEWVSAYITDFLVNAERVGYLVPASMKNSALNYLNTRANKWKVGDFYDEIEQSYRLRVLALAARPNLPAMNRLKQINYKNPIARWQLADAYALAGHVDVAETMIDNLPMVIDPYRQTGRCYGSNLRDNAIILQALTDMGARERAYEMIQKMAPRFSSGEWLSTQESAFGLTAIGAYVKKYFAGDNGVSVLLDGAPLVTPKTVARKTLEVKAGKSKASVKNNTAGILHARAINSSLPLGVITKGESSGIRLTATYYNGDTPVTGHRYAQGDDITVEISVTHTGAVDLYEELALSYLFPSGLEFYNQRLISGINPFPGADNADIRDDRVYLYFSLAKGKTLTFKLRFNAAYAGQYLLPAITCSAMYDNSITATLPGANVYITREE